VSVARFVATVPPGTDPAAAATVAEDLLERWGEPHREYHTGDHLARTLSIVDANARLADDLMAVRLAAWFHDAVYDPVAAPGANEAASAALAIQYLAILDIDEERADEVARLVRLTAEHDPVPGDRNGCLLANHGMIATGDNLDKLLSHQISATKAVTDGTIKFKGNPLKLQAMLGISAPERM